MKSNLPVVPEVGTAITAAEIMHIEETVAKRVRAIDDLDTLQEWRAQAAALEAYLRSKDLQRPMLGAQRRVEARIGELLGEALEGRPGHGNSRHTESINDEQRNHFRLLARGFANLDDEEWRKSRRALVAHLRHKLGLTPTPPPIPEGQYRCIVADPPWRLDTGPNVFNGTGESGHDELEYQQMSVDDIRSMPVQARAACDAHLYLWTTNRYIEAAYGIARAWGFQPSVLLVWAKTPRGIGLGDAYRLTTEFIVYARRGSLKENRIVETTWFNWPRGKHSEKPDAFYELVESMNSGPYLELFARRARPNWTVWGEEAPQDFAGEFIDASTGEIHGVA